MRESGRRLAKAVAQSGGADHHLVVLVCSSGLELAGGQGLEEDSLLRQGIHMAAGLGDRIETVLLETLRLLTATHNLFWL